MSDDRFGLCPECHETDGYLNAGSSHWFFCREHRKRWFIGTNLFSSHQDETEDQQREAWREVDDFADITGHAA